MQSLRVHRRPQDRLRLGEVRAQDLEAHADALVLPGEVPVLVGQGPGERDPSTVRDVDGDRLVEQRARHGHDAPDPIGARSAELRKLDIDGGDRVTEDTVAEEDEGVRSVHGGVLERHLVGPPAEETGCEHRGRLCRIEAERRVAVVDLSLRRRERLGRRLGPEAGEGLDGPGHPRRRGLGVTGRGADRPGVGRREGSDDRERSDDHDDDHQLDHGEPAFTPLPTESGHFGSSSLHCSAPPSEPLPRNRAGPAHPVTNCLRRPSSPHPRDGRWAGTSRRRSTR